MKTIALFACLGFLVACGEKESTTPDKTPAATDVEKMAGDKTPPADMPTGGAEMRTITVQIDGMT